MRAALSAGYEVIEEGLGGRTTVFDSLPEPNRSGKDLLVPILQTHAPLDLVIVLLGTNDVSLPYLTVDDIARGAGELVTIIGRCDDVGPKDAVAPDVLLVAPPVVGPLLAEDARLYAGAVERSQELGPAFAAVAERLGCDFFDLASVVATSPLDGWHWDAGEHTKAGRALAEAVQDAIGRRDQNDALNG
jgi:lysophospholipase L1-like esterase